MNIIGNAMQYCKRPGTVVVEVSECNGAVEVCVQDNGIGIAEEDLPRVFDRFFRGANAAKIKGTGLGLAITRMIIHSHGGAIWAESRPGEGSAFYFSLPREKKIAAPKAP